MFIGIFHIFNIAPKMASKGHVTIFYIIGLNKVVYISNILWTVHSDRLNGSGDTLCWTDRLSILRRPWNMRGTEVLVFWSAWQWKV